MKEKREIYHAKDFFHFFTDGYNFQEENRCREYKYKVPEEYGRGNINRYALKNGLEICVIDICLKKSIKLIFQVHIQIFEVVYCVLGNFVRIDQRIEKCLLEEGHFIINMKPEQERLIEIPRNSRLKCIVITAYNPFSQLFSYGENLETELINYKNLHSKKAEVLWRPQTITSALQSAFIEMENCKFEGLARLMYLECKAMEIISIALGKEVGELGKSNKKLLLHENDRQKISLAKKLIVVHMIEPLSINELAARVGLNTYKLKNGFKELYGDTIFGYLKNVRLEKAKTLLLANGEMNINEIVNEVGYSNTGHFAKAFREKYGVNPKKIRFRT